jgi:hypothetical protein
VEQVQNYVKFHIYLFSKNVYVLESSFKALSESAKKFSDLDLFHRIKAAWICDQKNKVFSRENAHR